MVINILIQKQTPRLEYIFSFICNGILHLDVKFHSQPSVFLSAQGIKFNYSGSVLPQVPFVQPKGLLVETSIQTDWLQKCRKTDIVRTFAATTNLKQLNHDIFAASFFLLSRYEEYIHQNRDGHGRFMAADSLAYQGGFLEKPIVDEWAMQLMDELKQWYPQADFLDRTFTAISTIDVDNNYAYLHKSWLRHIGSAVKNILRGDWQDLVTRCNVIKHNIADPFDTYGFINAIHDNYGITYLYFVLTGKYGRYDKNHPTGRPPFQKLVHQLRSETEIGLHPSYASNEKIETLIHEKKQLEKITGNAIIKSRQHYLKLDLPGIYRRLYAAGIKQDYTMGYHDHTGFRASTCSPFYFFDLEENKTMGLQVFPFAAMDITLRQYMKFTPAEAAEKLKSLVNAVKKVNGTWINLWHNESVSDFREWKGWRQVFEQSLKLIADSQIHS